MTATINPAEYFSVTEFSKRHSQHVKSEAALRWHVSRRRDNGMLTAGAIVETATGALRIHEPSYFAWWFGTAASAA